MFRKSIMLIALFVSISGAAHAGTYLDAMRTCGAEWKSSDQRKEVKKGEGMVAWQAFRKECTARVGWDSKKKKASAIEVTDLSARRKR